MPPCSSFSVLSAFLLPALNQEMSQESHPVHPLEHPDFDPFEWVPGVKIPLTPDASGISPRVGTRKRVVLPEPDCHNRRDLDFRHLIVEHGVEPNEFPRFDFAPVLDVSPGLQDQFFEPLLHPALRPAAEP